MQVSLLKLNAGIGSSVERAAALERSNGELRAQVSQLESGGRIQDKTASLGMVMPPAGQITYLHAGRGATAGAAAEALRQQSFNDPSKAQALPGEGDGQSDPWSTSTDSTSTDSTSSDSTSSDSTSTSSDSTSGDSSSNDSSSTSSDSSSGDSSSTDTSGATTASVGGESGSGQ
jgi:hypothetical protein